MIYLREVKDGKTILTENNFEEVLTSFRSEEKNDTFEFVSEHTSTTCRKDRMFDFAVTYTTSTGLCTFEDVGKFFFDKTIIEVVDYLLALDYNTKPYFKVGIISWNSFESNKVTQQLQEYLNDIINDRLHQAYLQKEAEEKKARAKARRTENEKLKERIAELEAQLKDKGGEQ